MAGMTLDELLGTDNKCMIVLSSDDKHSWKEVQEYLLSMGCLWPVDDDALLYPEKAGIPEGSTFGSYFIAHWESEQIYRLTFCDDQDNNIYAEQRKHGLSWFTTEQLMGCGSIGGDYDHAMGVI